MNNEVMELKIETLEKGQVYLTDKVNECMDLKTGILLLTQSVQKLDQTVDGLVKDKERKFNNIDALKYLVLGSILTGVVGIVIKSIFKL